MREAMEYEECPRRDERKTRDLVPSERLLQVERGKAREHDEPDDFLNGLELGHGIYLGAVAIGGHCQPQLLPIRT